MFTDKNKRSTMFIDGKELPVFKASLHNHSTSSDGLLPVADLARLYRDAGFDVFAISDHGVANDVSGIDIPGMTVLSGIELHPAGPRGILWHILALGVPGDFPGTGHKDGKAAADAAREVGAVIYVPHPCWTGLHTEEILELGPVQGIEIYNSGSRLLGRGLSDEIWDQMLDAGCRPCQAIATDDCHLWDSFALGWTMIAAPDRSPAALYDALRNGRCYASEGPEFHSIQLSDGHFSATFTEAVSAVVVSNRGLGYCARMPGAPIPGFEPPPVTSLDVDVSHWPKGNYVRCQIADAKGRRAWSQPYFL